MHPLTRKRVNLTQDLKEAISLYGAYSAEFGKKKDPEAKTAILRKKEVVSQQLEFLIEAAIEEGIESGKQLLQGDQESSGSEMKLMELDNKQMDAAVEAVATYMVEVDWLQPDWSQPRETCKCCGHQTGVSEEYPKHVREEIRQFIQIALEELNL